MPFFDLGFKGRSARVEYNAYRSANEGEQTFSETQEKRDPWIEIISVISLQNGKQLITNDREDAALADYIKQYLKETDYVYDPLKFL